MGKLVDIEELTPHQIDHFVASLEQFRDIRTFGDFVVQIAEDDRVYFVTQSGRRFPFAPTVDWRQCGPIIEKNDISIDRATIGWRAHRGGAAVGTGPTPLIAAMRTRVRMDYPSGVEVGNP